MPGAVAAGLTMQAGGEEGLLAQGRLVQDAALEVQGLNVEELHSRDGRRAGWEQGGWRLEIMKHGLVPQALRHPGVCRVSMHESIRLVP